ncbi:YaaL family protein [Salipaludibacillus sp. CUR1]|uniref:DUF2508 family protein n=1 Tax=Salipaludibacillus sp. CUR1 TaxID=2820003 RepID=UPI001E573818|nr:DUF2508 family protein [Salipaludibacillus sp. CUR1]MCE7792802.1 YaaL family protein [Salipaludibacillus sp. CUR1]
MFKKAKKKRKLRLQKDQELIHALDQIKNKAEEYETYLKNSIDSEGYVNSRARLERAKYLFLLKEARVRKTTIY